MNQPIETVNAAHNAFANVAGMAAILELKLRFLANRVAAIEEHSFAYSQQKTEEAVVRHFCESDMMTVEEGKVLTAAREIRNKFLHGEFDRAVELVEAFYHGSILFPLAQKIKVDSSNCTPETLENLKLSSFPTTSFVRLSLKDAGHFKWFIEAFYNGSFGLASKLFATAIIIVDRVSEARVSKRVQS